MVIPTHFGEYLLAAFVIILAPGPSVLFVIARAIAWGRKIAVLTVAGNVTGFFTISLIISIGLGPLLQKSDLAYAAIQWGGGAYLIYLGIDAIRHRRVHAGEMTNQGDVAPSTFRSMRDGFWVGFLNPKALVFNAAILPQFVDRNRGSVTAQLILLGATFAVIAFLSDGTWGLLAGTARTWLATDARRLERLRFTGGAVIVVLGISVIIAAVVSK
jgi:threonine/homoserine/homoserine lactone efflux protein